MTRFLAAAGTSDGLFPAVSLTVITLGLGLLLGLLSGLELFRQFEVTWAPSHFLAILKSALLRAISSGSSLSSSSITGDDGDTADCSGVPFEGRPTGAAAAFDPLRGARELKLKDPGLRAASVLPLAAFVRDGGLKNAT